MSAVANLKDKDRAVGLDPLLRVNIEPLLPFLATPGLIDLRINQPAVVWTETATEKRRHDVPCLDLKRLLQIASNLATLSGQYFDSRHPRLSCSLPSFGYRVQVNAYDTVSTGFAMTIRAGQSQRFPLGAYVDEVTAERLKKAVLKRNNIIVSGATGSGKTTLCNSLIALMPADERIATLEDPLELLVEHEDQVRFPLSRNATSQSGVSFDDVALDIMRHSPDRVIVGELGDHNVRAFRWLLNSGHAGTLSTMHADSSSEVFDKIVVMMSGAKAGNVSTTPNELRAELEKKIHVLIHIEKAKTPTGMERNVMVQFLER